MDHVKKIFMIVSMVLLMVGCHTVQGAGEDISAGGKAISNAAVKVSSKM
jgi:predicted small secreted protein